MSQKSSDAATERLNGTEKAELTFALQPPMSWYQRETSQSIFLTYRHDGYRLHPKNRFPVNLPDRAVLRTRGLPHLAQVVVLSKRCLR
jgi:hypothetical protein